MVIVVNQKTELYNFTASAWQETADYPYGEGKAFRSRHGVSYLELKLMFRSLLKGRTAPIIYFKQCFIHFGRYGPIACFNINSFQWSKIGTTLESSRQGILEFSAQQKLAAPKY